MTVTIVGLKVVGLRLRGNRVDSSIRFGEEAIFCSCVVALVCVNWYSVEVEAENLACCLQDEAHCQYVFSLWQLYAPDRFITGSIVVFLFLNCVAQCFYTTAIFGVPQFFYFSCDGVQSLLEYFLFTNFSCLFEQDDL